MLAIVILGNILARHVPKIPLPFFLIGLGAALAVMPSLRNFTLDPSVFSFAIIAPLLFNEGQNASRIQIGRSLTNIVSLAVGLVLLWRSCVVPNYSVKFGLRTHCHRHANRCISGQRRCPNQSFERQPNATIVQ